MSSDEKNVSGLPVLDKSEKDSASFGDEKKGYDHEVGAAQVVSNWDAI